MRQTADAPQGCMVACSARILSVAASTAATIWMQHPFDHLKEQLQHSVDNEDLQSALDVLSKLESVQVTKEVLESTRIGLVVNEARRRSSEWSPLLSKRCRVLIKQWQKLAELRPPSSCGSSSGGTPQLISPALRRGLTPRTPASRVTSTGLSLPDSGRDASPSMCPPNGGYAPTLRRTDSPRNGGVKSGISLSPPDDAVDSLTRRRLDADSAALANGSQKRGNIESEGSLLAARRKDVGSTSQLVATLSENLPVHMTVDLSSTEKLIADSCDTPIAGISPPLVRTVQMPSTKVERKGKRKRNLDEQQLPPSEMTVDKTELVHRFLDSSMPVASAESVPLVAQLPQHDWYATLPGLNELSARARALASNRDSGLDGNPRHGGLLKASRDGRPVLVLPYVDVGLPDFVEYDLPDAQRFLVDDASRPL